MHCAFIIMSAVFLVATAVLHSIAGEKLLIAPLLKLRDGVLKSDLARFLIRFAWHLTSLSWIALAAILCAFALSPNQAEHYALMATGLTFTLCGVYDAFSSRWRHIGWGFLTAIGVFALLGFATS